MRMAERVIFARVLLNSFGLAAGLSDGWHWPLLAAHEAGSIVRGRRRRCDAHEVREDRTERPRHAGRLVRGALLAAVSAVADTGAVLANDACREAGRAHVMLRQLGQMLVMIADV